MTPEAQRAGTNSSPKKILIVASQFPYPPTNGYQLRLWALLTSLAAERHELHLLAFGDARPLAAHMPAVLAVCGKIEFVARAVAPLASARYHLQRLASLPWREPHSVARFRSHAMASRIDEVIRTREVDVILCVEPYLLINFPSSLPVPLILDCHNIEHVLLNRYIACEKRLARRAYAWLESEKLRRWEEHAWKRSSLVMTCSPHDLDIIAEYRQSGLVLVPNVVSVDEYTPACNGDSSTVLFSGGMDWHPNCDAVDFFAFKILPLLRGKISTVRFVVAGRNPSKEFRRHFASVPGLRFTGTVPDMRAEIAKAAVCVVPLRIGSGTRLKILEAAAMAKPIVSTRIGAEGLKFTAGEEIALADEPEPFAQQVADLLSDPVARRAMGLAARRRVEKHYSLPTLDSAVREAMKLICPPIREESSATILPRTP